MSKPVIKRVHTDALSVDGTVQRSLDQRKVDRIAAEFNPEALGVVTVSGRGDGTNHVVDGQHRVAAVKALGGDSIMCRVFAGLTLPEEAELFRLLNNTNRPQKLDLFRVRVVEGDPVAVEIHNILSSYGWHLSTGHSQGAFAAVTAIERVHAISPVAVQRTIATLTRAWGHDTASVDGRLVEGVGVVYARYGDAVSIDDLTDRLARFPGGAGALVGKARGLRDLQGGTVVKAVAEIVVGQYNARRKTRALPDWRSA